MNDMEQPDKSGERIARVIARAGLASRREAEAWIAAGRVAVNGAVIHSPALNVTADDRISVDGETLPARERTRLFLYHKTRGLITSHADPQGRPTIFQRLPKGLPRLISVGRLDFNTEGLLLLTNDGALARTLELPRTGWLRRYRVRAHGAVTQRKLDELRDGLTVSGIHYGPIEATLDRVQGTNVWLMIAIREGKNREVRNVLTHFGLTVTRLIRLSFGPFQLGDLTEGAVEEVPTRTLREQLGERVAASSGADFSAPVAPQLPPEPAETPPPRERRRSAPAPRRERAPRDQQRERKTTTKKAAFGKSAAHTWRAAESERPTKKLRRKFRGSRRDERQQQEEWPRKRRSEVLTDRKGRPVGVERFGEPPQKPQPAEEPRRGGVSSGRRRSPDRSRGPRPHRPRGK